MDIAKIRKWTWYIGSGIAVLFGFLLFAAIMFD